MSLFYFSLVYSASLSTRSPVCTSSTRSCVSHGTSSARRRTCSLHASARTSSPPSRTSTDAPLMIRYPTLSLTCVCRRTLEVPCTFKIDPVRVLRSVEVTRLCARYSEIMGLRVTSADKLACDGVMERLVFLFQSKIVRVLNLWQKNSVFKSDIIQPLLDMAAGIPPPSVTPVPTSTSLPVNNATPG